MKVEVTKELEGTVSFMFRGEEIIARWEITPTSTIEFKIPAQAKLITNEELDALRKAIENHCQSGGCTRPPWQKRN